MPHMHRRICEVCGSGDLPISKALGVCRRCIEKQSVKALEVLSSRRSESRKKWGTPSYPPRSKGGTTCRFCGNECSLAPGEIGFCGLKKNTGGRIRNLAGTARCGIVIAYHDPLPTNCVASWVCGVEEEIEREEARCGSVSGKLYTNLAVFLGACTFDCLFCQNFSFREHTRSLSPLISPDELSLRLNEWDLCVCFFGGDPSAQLPFALASSRRMLGKASGRTLRICWETNGSMNRRFLEKVAKVSLKTGGCVKFDIKAFDEKLHIALTGTSNSKTLENFALCHNIMRERNNPPPLIASTLMVPGYVEEEEVRRIARFIAGIDSQIPYSLLAFHPDYLMNDLGTTAKVVARRCYEAALEEGLERVHVGNLHLLS